MRKEMTELEIMNFALDFNNLIRDKDAEIGRLKEENIQLSALVSSLSDSGKILTADDVRNAERGVWIKFIKSGYKLPGRYAIPLKDRSGVLAGEKNIYRYEHYGKTWVAYSERPQAGEDGHAD